ncbi:hypothetical protein THAOC_04705 [Thalassiosira oceanica]|uniref:Uncharacterized protein n=1 Tax=Thalassiosira oceanica TaxID=159749 RepID=K0TIQ4_THAOC|nr:hypothetical protein THAOC_04705 [Thalassiosira oceanica]|eukprot:EJK73661.1 hypothetical protein THAOC_04705 [Thalassiosira oceanica]
MGQRPPRVETATGGRAMMGSRRLTRSVSGGRGTIPRGRRARAPRGEKDEQRIAEEHGARAEAAGAERRKRKEVREKAVANGADPGQQPEEDKKKGAEAGRTLGVLREEGTASSGDRVVRPSTPAASSVLPLASGGLRRLRARSAVEIDGSRATRTTRRESGARRLKRVDEVTRRWWEQDTRRAAAATSQDRRSRPGRIHTRQRSPGLAFAAAAAAILLSACAAAASRSRPTELAAETLGMMPGHRPPAACVRSKAGGDATQPSVRQENGRTGGGAANGADPQEAGQRDQGRG